MKTLLSILLVLASSLALAEACPNNEYAELKDMKPAELISKYCEMKNYQVIKEKEAERLARNGEIVSLQYMKYSFACKRESERIAGILERQFATPLPECQKQEISSETDRK